MENKQDKEFWDKFVKVFNVDVSVNVQKTVTKDDIILSLLSEGDFIFAFEKGHTKINLKGLGNDKETIEALKKVIWNPIEEYLLNHPTDTPTKKEEREK